MADPQLIEDVGVVNREIGDDEICGQQALEHVDPDVALLQDLDGVAAGHPERVQRRIDQFVDHTIEVDALLDPEGADDEGAHGLLPFFLALSIPSQLTARSACIRLAPSHAAARRPGQIANSKALIPDPPRALASSTSSHSRLGLSGISRISRPGTASASSSAWAKGAPTGMAPASPAPLAPRALSVETVPSWPTSTRGTSRAPGSTKSMKEPLRSCPFSS